jgi:hypothetical protein
VDIPDDVAGGCLGELFVRIIVTPFHFVAWATGVLMCNTISLGRFQIEPFVEDPEWYPEEGRPILYGSAATFVGFTVWVIAILVISRNSLF